MTTTTSIALVIWWAILRNIWQKARAREIARIRDEAARRHASTSHADSAS